MEQHALCHTAAFTVATGQEAHGRSGSSGFVNAAGGDYTLTSGSPLIDAGVALLGINDSYAGAAPDLGAFEVRGACVYLPLTLKSYHL